MKAPSALLALISTVEIAVNKERVTQSNCSPSLINLSQTVRDLPTLFLPICIQLAYPIPGGPTKSKPLESFPDRFLDAMTWARRCGKVSRHSLRIDLGSEGSVGGQGSPSRNVQGGPGAAPLYDLSSRRACLPCPKTRKPWWANALPRPNSLGGWCVGKPLLDSGKKIRRPSVTEVLCNCFPVALFGVAKFATKPE